MGITASNRLKVTGRGKIMNKLFSALNYDRIKSGYIKGLGKVAEENASFGVSCDGRRFIQIWEIKFSPDDTFEGIGKFAKDFSELKFEREYKYCTLKTEKSEDLDAPDEYDEFTGKEIYKNGKRLFNHFEKTGFEDEHANEEFFAAYNNKY